MIIRNFRNFRDIIYRNYEFFDFRYINNIIIYFFNTLLFL